MAAPVDQHPLAVPAQGPRLLFRKAARLRTSHEFHQVRDHGSSLKGRMVILGILPSEGAPATGPAIRLGIVTSKRVGAAHERNRARRRLREIMRELLPHLSTPSHLVLVAKRQAATGQFAALRTEVRYLLTKAGLLPAAPAGALQLHGS